MKTEKRVLAELDKCYSIAPLMYQGKPHFLIAAEKHDRCLLFDYDGNLKDTVWKEPGGVMTMVQVPGTDGQFLATHEFYSPNDSKNARIIICTPVSEGNWDVRTLCDLPFVHRFDILERNGRRYLIACALKSDHEYKDDWRFPGKVYGAELPEDLSSFDSDHQLKLTVLKDGLLKNHGYCHLEEDGVQAGLVGAENGVFRFTPPAEKDGEWTIEQILDEPASDAVLVDFDGDGVKELLTITPFHGDTIKIYKQEDGSFREVYEYPEPAEMSHAIWGGTIQGKPCAVIGYRKGKRNLMVFTWDQGYQVQIIDEDCGAANVTKLSDGEREFLVAANRETNEIALYEILK